MKTKLTERMDDMVETAHSYISGCSRYLQLDKTDTLHYHIAVIKMYDDIKQHTNERVIEELKCLLKEKYEEDDKKLGFPVKFSVEAEEIENRIKELEQHKPTVEPPEPPKSRIIEGNVITNVKPPAKTTKPSIKPAPQKKQ